MPYTNGIFYIHPTTGSDAARTALTSCIASNPSGTITRITKTGHGLETGAVVDLTLFSAWLNGSWKITVNDANTFDLDGAVWRTTPDNDGTVTPRGGSRNDPWKTATSGATTGRTQTGDELRAPVNTPVSTGVNATFTSGSKNVTLAAALTKTVEHCIGNTWNTATDITGSTNTSRKIGATAQVLTPATAFTTGKVAWKTVDGGGTQDFSAYQKISFWFRPTSNTVIVANTYRICLCSDANGDTVVNQISIPATLNNSNWHIVTLDNGAALGSSIQSVAIYADIDPGTTAFSIQNIVACNNVTHETLFGWQDDCFYNVQAFDDTTITIDSNNTVAGGQGWYGTNGTALLYYVQPFTFFAHSNNETMNRGGTYLNGAFPFSGGWDFSTDTRTGLTYFANNLVGTGNGIISVQFRNNFSNFCLSRWGNPFSLPGNAVVENIIACGSNTSLAPINGRVLVSNCKFLNNANGPGGQISMTIYDSCMFFNNSGASSASQYIDCVFANNTNASINANAATCGSELWINTGVLKNCLLLDTVEVNTSSSTTGIVWSRDNDQTLGNHWGFTYGATINWQTTEKHTGQPGSWRVVHTSSGRSIYGPVIFRVSDTGFLVKANELVTFKAWVKKDHATDVGCRIKVFDETSGFSLPGITETITTAADNTNWQELTITFTPTQTGVINVYFESWRAGAQSNTYLGTVSITQ